jgi:hypothetical protein
LPLVPARGDPGRIERAAKGKPATAVFLQDGEPLRGALAPVIEVSEKATVNPASGTARDFTAPATYTVTAEDGSVQDYTVTVTVLTESPPADRTALNTAITTANDAKQEGTKQASSSLTKPVGFAGEEYSSGTTFDDTRWTGYETDTEGWTLSTTAEQHLTYFAVYKEAAQTIIVSGDDAARVSMAASGTTVVEATDAGLTASDTLAVFTVKTGDLVFDGGARTFTLEVTEPGALPLTVTITLKVETTKTGGAVFKLAEKAGDVEYLTRISGENRNFDGLVSAFTWLESNAEANTEYTIRVEKNETDLPHLIVSLNNAENATLRLRGTSDGPKILYPGDIDSQAGATNIAKVNVNSLNGGTNGFIQVGGDTNLPNGCRRTTTATACLTRCGTSFPGAMRPILSGKTRLPGVTPLPTSRRRDRAR